MLPRRGLWGSDMSFGHEQLRSPYRPLLGLPAHGLRKRGGRGVPLTYPDPDLWSCPTGPSTASRHPVPTRRANDCTIPISRLPSRPGGSRRNECLRAPQCRPRHSRGLTKVPSTTRAWPCGRRPRRRHSPSSTACTPAPTADSNVCRRLRVAFPAPAGMTARRHWRDAPDDRVPRARGVRVADGGR